MRFLALSLALFAALTFAPQTYARGSGSHSRCVGICYGVASTVNGLPRDRYVHGYVKKDGTVVQPYTRSK